MKNVDEFDLRQMLIQYHCFLSLAVFDQTKKLSRNESYPVNQIVPPDKLTP